MIKGFAINEILFPHLRTDKGPSILRPIGLFIRTRGKWFKIVGVAYPAMTLLAITITANHYIMDAIGGTILMMMAFAVVELGFRRRLFFPRIRGSLGSFGAKMERYYSASGGRRTAL